MRKIGITISKGGTGKTTTAVNLASGLARLKYKVLLIDTDTQAQAGLMLGQDPENGLAEFILDGFDFDECITEARQNLFLLAGGRRIGKVKADIGRKEYSAEFTLADALKGNDDTFDFVIVDTGPGWDALTINVLFYVNEILSPVSLEVLSLHSLVEFQKRIREIQDRHTGLELKYIVPTFADGRVKKTQEITEQLKSHFKGILCHPIKYSVRLSESAGHGQNIFEYSPKSAGAIDYAKLIRRILDND